MKFTTLVPKEEQADAQTGLPRARPQVTTSDTQPTRENGFLPDIIHHFASLYLTCPDISVNCLVLSLFLKFTNCSGRIQM